VCVTATLKENPGLSSPPGLESVGEAQATTNLDWAEVMENESSELPPLFESLTTTGQGPEGSEGDSEDLDAEFTTAVSMGVDEDNDALLPAQPSQPVSAQGESLTSLPVESLLAEIWMETGFPPAPPKQLLPLVPDCLAETKWCWDKLLSLNATNRGLASVDVIGMEELGLSSPPPVELAVAQPP